MFTSFTGLHRPVKGTKVSTVLSTPRQATIPPSYLDIGMGGYFEGFGVYVGRILTLICLPYRADLVGSAMT